MATEYRANTLRRRASKFLRLDRQPGQVSALRIDADLIILGQSNVAIDNTIIVCDGKISHVGSTSGLPATYQNIPVHKVKIAMPGLWDCQSSFHSITAVLQVSRYSSRRDFLYKIDMVNLIDAGFTSIRGTGGFGHYPYEPTKHPDLVAPHIYPSSSPISPAFLVEGLPLDHRVLDRLTLAADRTSKPKRAAKIAKERIKNGFNVITVGAPCTHLRPIDNDKPVKPLIWLRTIVAMAQKHKAVVTAVCPCPESVLYAIEGGCKTVEYSGELNTEVSERLTVNNVALVASQSAFEVGAGGPSSPELQDTIPTTMKQLSRESYERAVQRGLKVILGSSHIVSPTSHIREHGSHSKEIRIAAQSGLSAHAIVEGLTVAAAQSISKDSFRSGQIRVGYDADIIALNENPLDDVTILGDPGYVTHVWKNGRPLKLPGHPVSLTAPNYHRTFIRLSPNDV